MANFDKDFMMVLRVILSMFWFIQFLISECKIISCNYFGIDLAYLTHLISGENIHDQLGIFVGLVYFEAHFQPPAGIPQGDRRKRAQG